MKSISISLFLCAILLVGCSRHKSINQTDKTSNELQTESAASVSHDETSSKSVLKTFSKGYSKVAKGVKTVVHEASDVFSTEFWGGTDTSSNSNVSEDYDVDKTIPEGEKAGKYDIAVIIGNRNYAASGSPNVEYANRDAQVVRNYLTHTMGFNQANIIYAEDATLTMFYEIFGTKDDYKGKLFKWVKTKQSKVFIYYVGHGAPDIETNEAYFVPVDANPQFLKISGYRLQTLYDNLAKINAQNVTVVIDACFSGMTVKGTLFKGTSALVRQEKIVTRKPLNALIIASSSGEQLSSWYPEKGHSLFTYFFLKGLSGAADVNNDSKVTVGELRTYLTDQVPYMARKLTGNEQTPQITGKDTDVFVSLKK